MCVKCDSELTGEGNWKCSRCNFLPVMENEIIFFNKNLSIKNNTFDPQLFDKYSDIEHSFWITARNELVLWALQNFASQFDNFLEIGVGTGLVLKKIKDRFPNARYTALDIFEESLVDIKSLFAHVNLIQADAEKLPFFEEFDVIGCFDVIEHIKNDDVVISQIYKSLKKNGLLILTVPHHPFLYCKRDEFLMHKRRYRKSELDQKLKNVGFELCKSTCYTTALLPAHMILNKFNNLQTRNGYSTFKDLNIGSTLTGIANLLLGFERYFIKIGVNFSIGGSLFIVARKK